MSINTQTNRHQFSGYVQQLEATYYRSVAPTVADPGTAGAKWYVTTTGTNTGTITSIYHYDAQNAKWVKFPGSPNALTPQLAPVLSIITAPPTTPNDQQRHIIKATATGVWAGKEGQIAEWDAANNTWVYYTPNNLDQTTVTTGTDAGVWQYDKTSKAWVQIQQGVELTLLPDLPEAGRLRLTRHKQVHTDTSGTQWLFIQNESVVVYGTSSSASAGDGSNSNNLPRKLSVNYLGGSDNNYTPGASYFPKFVDAVMHKQGMILALDSNGKLWCTGTLGMAQMGHTTTASGTTTVSRTPQYGLAPIQYWQTGPGAGVKIAKLYQHPNRNSAVSTITSYALATTGDVYAVGANTQGQCGNGTLTDTTQWAKVPGLSSVVKIVLSTTGALFLTKSGGLYKLGNIYPNSGAATSTATLVLSGVADVCVMSPNATSVYAAKTDGTLWVCGANASGQLALGTTTTQAAFTQVAGVNDAWKVFAPDAINISYFALLRKDGSVSFAGANTGGVYGYGAVNTNYNILVTPTGSWQGTIVDVICGYSTTYVISTDGKMYGAGPKDQLPVGGSPTDANIWLQVPLAEAALGARTAAYNGVDGVVVLQADHKLVGWGFGATLWNGYQTRAYAPTYIPLEYVDDSMPLATSPVFVPDLVGALGTVTAITAVTDLVDGTASQTITFTVSYTGGTVGGVDITATATGANITSAVSQTSAVVIQSASGTFQVSFTVTPADVAALTAPAAQAQPWALTINGTTLNSPSTASGNGWRVTIPDMTGCLTTSLAAYNAAASGALVPVTTAEYTCLLGYAKSTAGLSNTAIAATPQAGWTSSNWVAGINSYNTVATGNDFAVGVPFLARIRYNTASAGTTIGTGVQLGYAATDTGAAVAISSKSTLTTSTDASAYAYFLVKNPSVTTPAGSNVRVFTGNNSIGIRYGNVAAPNDIGAYKTASTDVTTSPVGTQANVQVAIQIHSI